MLNVISWILFALYQNFRQVFGWKKRENITYIFLPDIVMQVPRTTIRYVDKPVYVDKVVEKRVEVPVEVEKRVEVPVPYEKIVLSFPSPQLCPFPLLPSLLTTPPFLSTIHRGGATLNFPPRWMPRPFLRLLCRIFESQYRASHCDAGSRIFTLLYGFTSTRITHSSSPSHYFPNDCIAC